MEYYLKKIEADDNDSISITLTGQEFVFGRSTLQIPTANYPTMSRRHAKFIKGTDSWYVKDLESINGLYVNTRRVGGEIKKLNIGDHIGFGSTSPFEGFVCAYLARLKKEILAPCDIKPLVHTSAPSIITLNASTSSDHFSAEVPQNNCLVRVKEEKATCDQSSGNDVKHNAVIIPQQVPPQKHISSNIESSQSVAQNKTIQLSKEPIKDIPSSSHEICRNQPKKSAVVKEEKTASPYFKLKCYDISAQIRGDSVVPQGDISNQSSAERVSDTTKKMTAKNRKRLSQNTDETSPTSTQVKSSHLSSSVASDFEQKEKKTLGHQPVQKDYKESFSRNCELITVDQDSSSDESLIEIDVEPKQPTETSVRMKPTAVLDSSPLNLKKCTVNLVRYDSKNFKAPRGIKLPSFLQSDNQIKSSQRKSQKSKATCPSFGGDSNFSHDTSSSDTSSDSFLPNIFSKNLERKFNISTDTSSSDESAISNDDIQQVDAFDNLVLNKNNLSGADKTKQNYSQVEEVITISDNDDETYFDFSSSQVIKQEPLDEDDCFENDDFFNPVGAMRDYGNSPALSENMENITNFLGHSSNSGGNKTFQPCSSVQKLEATAAPSNLVNISEHFEDMNSLESNDDERSSISSHNEEKRSRNAIETNINKKRRHSEISDEPHNNFKFLECAIPTGRKIMLTEAKAIDKKPKYKRGREEWFEEKTVPTPMVNISKKARPSTTKSKHTSSKKLSPLRSKQISKRNLSLPKSNFKIPKKTQSPFKRRETSVVDKAYDNPEKNKLTLEGHSPKKPARISHRSCHSRSDFLVNLPSQNCKPPTSKKKNLTFTVKQTNSSQNVKRGSSLRKTNGKNSPSEKLPPILPDKKSLRPSTHWPRIDVPVPESSPVPPRRDLFSKFNDNVALVKPMIPANDPRLRKRLSTINDFTPNVSDSHGHSLQPSAILTNAQANQQCPMPIQYSVLKKQPSMLKYSLSSYNLSTSPVKRSENPGPSYCNDSGAMMHTSAVYRSSNPESKKKVIDKRHLNLLIKKRIVELNFSWLKEQRNISKPPPTVCEGVNALPLSFRSIDRYIEALAPMLFLEIWEQMCEDSKSVLQDKSRNVQKFFFTIVKSNKSLYMDEYHCCSVVNHLSFEPTRGNLVILDVMESNQGIQSHLTKQTMTMFGYINDCSIKDIHRQTLSPEWNNLGKDWHVNAKLYNFSVYVKARKFVPVYNYLRKGNGISQIQQKVRLAEALQFLPSSPLCDYILCPTEAVFNYDQSAVTPSRNYNTIQRTAIQGIKNAILNSRTPKILLLQGPPGTGKTHTIVGLLEHLKDGKRSSKKILLTAPSNAAIDEIGRRLIDLKGQNLNFVRVGNLSQVSSQMKPFYLDELAKVEHGKDFKDDIKYKQKEINDLKENVKKLSKMKSSQQDNLQSMKHQLQKLEENFHSQHQNIRDLDRYKKTVLGNCDIVLTTLGSCRNRMLTSSFNRHLSFSCCIVDEATQCTELDLLQVLQFGINKLILVGDHKQLPAIVSSKIASKCNFGRSMFERFHLYFSQQNKPSPVLMLTEQFRMHPEICKLPSQLFYHSQLVTSVTIGIEYETFPVIPYIVLNIAGGKERDNSTSKANSEEALVTVTLCTELLNLHSRISIGIITPYSAQKKLYEDNLRQHPKYNHIEVDTVDAFQGREKDVIILSCVRANGCIGFLSCRKRLNVAITRARKCLIICCHADTLIQNPDWRRLLEDARRRELYKSVTSHKDIHKLFADKMVKKK